MRSLLVLAFKNLWRSKNRSVALFALLTVGCASVILIGAGYDSLLNDVAFDHVKNNGDILLKNDGEDALTWDSYVLIKQRLLASGVITNVLAEAPVSGLLGNGDYAAPASGVAVEVAQNGEIIPATLGKALADTLRVSKGSVINGLVGDVGMSVIVQDIVQTEAILKDRFFIKIPVGALLVAGENPTARTINVWLDTKNKGAYIEAKNIFAAIPELSSYTLFSIPERNTIVEQIRSIYNTNYAVVTFVIAITLLLAFLNVLSLTVYERQQELGTMRAMGTPIHHLVILLTAETGMIALLSAFAGILFSVIASGGINAAGGLTFPPPPGSEDPLIIGSSLSWAKTSLAAALVVGSAGMSSLISTRGLGKTRVTKQLENRN